MIRTAQLHCLGQGTLPSDVRADLHSKVNKPEFFRNRIRDKFQSLQKMILFCNFLHFLDEQLKKMIKECIL